MLVETAVGYTLNNMIRTPGYRQEELRKEGAPFNGYHRAKGCTTKAEPQLRERD
jgi:hypothetical protein